MLDPFSPLGIYCEPLWGNRNMRVAHTAPLGAGGSSRIEYLVFFVNILPRRGPKGRAHTAPLGAGKDPDSTPSGPLWAYIVSTIYWLSITSRLLLPLWGNEQSGRRGIGGSFQPSIYAQRAFVSLRPPKGAFQHLKVQYALAPSGSA